MSETVRPFTRTQNTHLAVRSNDHTLRDALLGVRIPRLADAEDPAVLDANVRLTESKSLVELRSLTLKIPLQSMTSALVMTKSSTSSSERFDA
jgi:hypothetical protein